MKTKEIWKDIKGYEGIYQISSFGRVKSMEREVGSRNNTRRLREKMLSQFLSSAGYPTVNLYKDSNLKASYVHRLISEAFIPNPENKPQVKHIDGDKRNNDLSNLEWCTIKENRNHAAQKGLAARGAQAGIAKLNRKAVLEIKALLKSGEKQKKIAKRFNVSICAINDINTGRTWSWLTGINS